MCIQCASSNMSERGHLRGICQPCTCHNVMTTAMLPPILTREPHIATPSALLGLFPHHDGSPRRRQWGIHLNKARFNFRSFRRLQTRGGVGWGAKGSVDALGRIFRGRKHPSNMNRDIVFLALQESFCGSVVEKGQDSGGTTAQDPEAAMHPSPEPSWPSRSFRSPILSQ
jgi:hypothetical protein